VDPAKALEVLELLRREISSAPPSRPPITWHRLWELYSADPPVSPNTFTTYGYLWASWLGQWFGERLVSTTTVADVAAYRYKRKNDLTRRGGRTTRPATRNREVMLLRTLATWGMKHGHLPGGNPLATLNDEEYEDNIRETVITAEMLARAQPWLPQLVLVYIVVVLDSGLRRDECRGLRWSQIDFEHGVIEMSRKQTKAKRSRYTQLSGRAAELLQNLPRVGDYVFENPKRRKPYTPDWFFKKWRRACEKGGVTGPDGNVTIHDGRRTFATEMRRAGVQESEIMAMGGWTTPEVFTRYNVISFDDIVAARKKYEAHLRRSARRPARKSEKSMLTCSGKSISIETARTER
jgi:integrase